MENIKSLSLIKTQKQNKYFYDRKLKRLQLCHPLLHYILKLSDGMNVDAIRNWIDNLDDNLDAVEIENYGFFSKKEIEYYFQKFLFLKKNEFFSEIDQHESCLREIDADDVKHNIINCKSVVFEATERCQLSCAYCGYGKYYHNFEQRENKNLDIKMAKRLLDYLVPFWNSPLNQSHDENIYINFYGGESLLNFPFINEIVDYANQIKLLHNKFAFAITTNGILLQKYIEFLCKNDFRLLISLDGNEQNNVYRVFKNGKTAYKKILENIDILQRKYPEYFLRRVNFISVHHNKNSVSDIYHFFKNQFGKFPEIIGLDTSGIKESLKKEFWKTFANIDQSLHENEDYSVIEKDMFFKLPNIQDAKICLYNLNDFCFNNYNDLIYPQKGKKKNPTGTCSPFSVKIFLTARGKLLPCERIGCQFSLGQVTSDMVELDFEKIAKKYNNYYNKIKKQCGKCHNAESCNQCMFNISTIDDETPICNGFMNKNDYERYLSSNVSYFENKPELFSKLLRENNRE